jgi:hypothetical protein
MKIKKNNLGFSKIWLILSIIIFSGIILGEIIYLLQDKNNKVNYSKIKVNTLAQQEFEPEGSEQEIVFNCGNIFSNIDKTESKKIMDCMDENYQICKPAKITFDVDTNNGKIITHFEIIGLKEGLCQIKVKYSQHILNPEREGLEMICSFENNKGIKEIVYNELDLTKCEGELVRVMR